MAIVTEIGFSPDTIQEEILSIDEVDSTVALGSTLGSEATVDEVVLVYSDTGDYSDAQLLDGATLADGTTIRIRAIINPADPNNPDAINERLNALTGDSATALTGPHGIWLLNGAIYQYNSPTQPRDDDYDPSYDMDPLSDITLNAGEQVVTFRADYDNGIVEDHVYVLTVAAEPISAEISPAIETSASVALQNHLAINPALEIGVANQFQASLVTAAYVDSWIPQGFPNSMSTGIRASGLTEDDLTVFNGDFTSSSNGQVVSRLLINGRAVTSHTNVRYEECIVRGDQSGKDACEYTGTSDGGPTYYRCEIGPKERYVFLAADIAFNDSTCDIDHSDDEFAATGLPVGPVGESGTSDTNHTYLLFGLSTGLIEQARTNGKTDLGNGVWRYSLERHTGGDWSKFTAITSNVLKFAHSTGEPIAYHRRQEDGDTLANAIGSSNSGNKSHEVIECDIHGCNDGVKGAHATTTLVKDSLIREAFCIPVAHLDGVQGFNAGDMKVIHTTFGMAPSPNSCIKYGDSQNSGVIKFSYFNGGATKCIQCSIPSAEISWTRFGLVRKNAMASLGGSETLKDNRSAVSGTTWAGDSTAAGEVLSTNTGSPGGNKDGSLGDGEADKWGEDFADDPDWDESYRLPGNLP